MHTKTEPIILAGGLVLLITVVCIGGLPGDTVASPANDKHSGDEQSTIDNGGATAGGAEQGRELIIQAVDVSVREVGSHDKELPAGLLLVSGKLRLTNPTGMPVKLVDLQAEIRNGETSGLCGFLKEQEQKPQPKVSDIEVGGGEAVSLRFEGSVDGPPRALFLLITDVGQVALERIADGKERFDVVVSENISIGKGAVTYDDGRRLDVVEFSIAIVNNSSASWRFDISDAIDLSDDENNEYGFIYGNPDRWAEITVPPSGRGQRDVRFMTPRIGGKLRILRSSVLGKGRIRMGPIDAPGGATYLSVIGVLVCVVVIAGVSLAIWLPGLRAKLVCIAGGAIKQLPITCIWKRRNRQAPQLQVQEPAPYPTEPSRGSEAPATEEGAPGRPLGRFSVGGVIVAAILVLFTVLSLFGGPVAVSMPSLGAGVAMLVRSLRPPIGWKRGMQTFFGGLLVGAAVTNLMMGTGSEEAAGVIGWLLASVLLAILGAVLIRLGFKQAKIP